MLTDLSMLRELSCRIEIGKNRNIENEMNPVIFDNNMSILYV